jgi:hypothetical protein
VPLTLVQIYFTQMRFHHNQGGQKLANKPVKSIGISG